MNIKYNPDTLRTKGKPWNTQECLNIYEDVLMKLKHSYLILDKVLSEREKRQRKKSMFILNSLLKFSDYLNDEGFLKESELVDSVVEDQIKK
jgi:hypothetical protein